MSFFTPIIVAFAAIFASFVVAGPGHHGHGHQHEHEKHRGQSLSSHVHGEAELTIAMEAGVVALEFRSPAVNIVGFEHAAHTAEQVQRVENTHKKLKSAATLFQFASDQCQVNEVSVDVSNLLELSVDQGGCASGLDEHREILAQYRYRCDTPASLTVAVFEFFPGVEQLNVVWVSSAQQGAKRLNPQDRTIEFD